MRRTLLIAASGLAFAGIVTGCSASAPGPSPEHPGSAEQLVESDVSPGSTPRFLSDPQGDLDTLPSEADFASADPASVRYQGVWDGKSVFLAVSGETQVQLIVGVPGDDATWAANSSVGNSVIGLGDGESGELGLQYLPQGTADAPDGWAPLSDHIIVKPDA